MESYFANEPIAVPFARGGTPSRRSRNRCNLLLVVLTIVVGGLATFWVIDLVKDNDDQPSSAVGKDDEPKATNMPTVQETTVPSTYAPVVCENVVYSDVSSCHYDFRHCQTDRLSHSTPVCAGQSLCNGVFRLEVTLEGHFQWKNCTSGETIRFFDSPIHSDLNHFVLGARGVLQVRDGDSAVVWELASSRNIEPQAECRTNPVHDCPYMHLQKAEGAMVLNWIWHGGVRVSRDFKRVYPGLLDS